MKKRTPAQIPTTEPPRFYWELWRDRTQPYIPYFWEELVSQAMIFFLFLALVGGLALLWPADLAPRANVLVTPAGIKPEWYFLANYQTLKIFPSELLGLSVQAAAMTFLALLPFIDRSPERNPMKRPLFLVCAIGGILLWIGLTIWGHFS